MVLLSPLSSLLTTHYSLLITNSSLLTKTVRLSYKTKLLANFSALFALFAVILVVFQNQREEQYKMDLLESRLRSYADLISGFDCIKNKDIDNDIAVPLLTALPHELRITVLTPDGDVQYDSGGMSLGEMDNHLSRPEVMAALQSSEGHFIRTSTTTQRPFFYFAKAYPDCIVRVALPYDSAVENLLKADNVFLWFVLLVFPIVLVLLIYVSDHFGKSITMLRRFIDSAERGLVDYNHLHFPDGELGQISRTILEKYKQLEDSHKAVLKEREKRRIYKRDMSNNITHELRTPVSSISGYLETLLCNTNLSEERRRGFLERAHLQTQRLAAIIRDISLITKVDEAPEMMPREAISLSLIVAEVCEELANPILQRKATLHCNLPEEAMMNGNYSLIHAVFRNLIENSLRYTAEGVHIYLSLDREDATHYYFTYYDNGTGVEARHLSRLFERFYRAQEGRTRDSSNLGGTGLGLSIVRNAVLFHRGNISVRNRPEAGLEFTFSLGK